MPAFYFGVDISKDHLDLCDGSTGRIWRIANDVEAITSLIPELGNGVHVILEATGSYDRVLRRLLSEHGVSFSRINPRRARSFADAAGFLAKTDAVDAMMLAEYGKRFEPEPTAVVDPIRDRLSALLLRRDQLVGMRKQEKVRLQQVEDEDIRADLEEMIAILSQRVTAFEIEMRDLINRTSELSHIDQRLRAVPGIADINAATLIAGLPELGRLDRRAIAALAGIAPLAADSGKHRGARKIKGGRRQIRKALYMAAVTARRNNQFEACYKRLIDAGKPPKVALIATARKILVTINAMIRDDTEFKQLTA